MDVMPAVCFQALEPRLKATFIWRSASQHPLKIKDIAQAATWQLNSINRQ
jgi:hypothetical protein